MALLALAEDGVVRVAFYASVTIGVELGAKVNVVLFYGVVDGIPPVELVLQFGLFDLLALSVVA